MATAPLDSAKRAAESIFILIPVFNDWSPLQALLERLEQVLRTEHLTSHVLVVDDGSTAERDQDAFCRDWQALGRCDVLELRRNLGHQRAIAVGLAYLEDRERSTAVVVMDGDGEDDPCDVPVLLKTCREKGLRKIVFAARRRRSEAFPFQIFYILYQVLYRLLTGRTIHFGNFSVIPQRCLSSLVSVSEIWNHYAAAVLKSRLPYCLVATRRAKRLDGESKMRFDALVIHGLSAISVDSELVGVRLLVLSLVMIVVALVGLVVIVGIRVGTNLAIPGWATTAFGVITMLLFQSVMLTVIFSFITLSGRQGTFFLPKRDYDHFVRRTYSLWPDP